MDDWQTVNRKKGSKRRGKNIAIDEVVLDINSQEWTALIIPSARQEMKKLAEEVSPLIGDFDQMIFLGVGRLSTRNAQYQVAMAMEILSETTLVSTSCFHSSAIQVYEPLLDDNEKELLRNLKFEILPDNDSGMGHQIDQVSKVLFFMPHCNVSLYNNILCTNWTRNQLGRIVFLGNSFANYIDRLPESKGKCIRAILPYITQIPFPPLERNSCCEKAFSDTTIQYFTDESLEKGEINGIFQLGVESEEIS